MLLLSLLIGCIFCVAYAERKRQVIADAIILGTMEVVGGDVMMDENRIWAIGKEYVEGGRELLHEVDIHHTDFERVMPALYAECVKWACECDEGAMLALMAAVVHCGQVAGPAFVPRADNNLPRKYFYHEVAIAHGYYKREKLPETLLGVARDVWPSFSADDYMGHKDK